ncbi:TerC family protein [Desulfitobacterium metallireducens]|uniref:Membrane protein n=1 Tax=Desulfitobacterium metallireducens DSM 15288 TaxID=871968 RepID=W0EAU2_9FIRM|nr:TerC family protein [Desulfitobacterium metallireducens]AHF06648.1 membrane protein [Desulfitobacterium metallireducens DSM 15288]
MAGLLGGVLSIVAIDLILSGDNAVVIALATLRLNDRDRKKGIFWGTFGAVALRIFLATVAIMLLKLPFIQAVGGVLLSGIAINLLKDKHDDENVKAAGSLKEAIQTIIFADFLMSLDNVLAVAGAAKGNILLLVFGLMISIPIVIFGSNIISKFMKKWPWLVSLGAGLLGFTAGGMILNDSYFSFLSEIPILNYLIPGVFAMCVIIIGNALKKRNKLKSVEQEDEHEIA